MSVLELVLGLLLLLFAVRQWRRRPRGDEPTELPKLLQTIDTFTPGKAFATAVALAALNPKNLLLTVGAAAAIAQTGIDTVEQVVALEVFVVIGTPGVAAPVAIYYALRRDVPPTTGWGSRTSSAGTPETPPCGRRSPTAPRRAPRSTPA